MMEQVFHPLDITHIMWKSQFPICSNCYQHRLCNTVFLYKISLKVCFHPGSQVEIEIGCLSVKVCLGNYVTSDCCTYISYHTCISNSKQQCHSIFVFYNMSKQGLNGVCSNCHYMTLILVIQNILCAEFIYFFIHLKFLTCVQFIFPVELVIIEEVITLSPMSKMGKNELL